jgi:hypothetical protein
MALHDTDALGGRTKSWARVNEHELHPGEELCEEL